MQPKPDDIDPRRATELDTSDADTWYNLGNVLAELGRLQIRLETGHNKSPVQHRARNL